MLSFGTAIYLGVNENWVRTNGRRALVHPRAALGPRPSEVSCARLVRPPRAPFADPGLRGPAAAAEGRPKTLPPMLPRTMLPGSPKVPPMLPRRRLAPAVAGRRGLALPPPPPTVGGGCCVDSTKDSMSDDVSPRPASPCPGRKKTRRSQPRSALGACAIWRKQVCHGEQ